MIMKNHYDIQSITLHTQYKAGNFNDHVFRKIIKLETI